MKKTWLANAPELDELIREVRGQKVMLDTDLARIYGIPTFRFNEAIKRNRERFPEDFMFRLTGAEVAALTSQFAISKKGRGGRRTLPYAFTEHGPIMAANVGHSRARALASYPRCIAAYPRGSRSRVFSTAHRGTDEYDVRGRRWMDCIGRLVRRPSDRESASHRLCRSSVSQNARIARRQTRTGEKTCRARKRIETTSRCARSGHRHNSSTGDGHH